MSNLSIWDLTEIQRTECAIALLEKFVSQPEYSVHSRVSELSEWLTEHKNLEQYAEFDRENVRKVEEWVKRKFDQ